MATLWDFIRYRFLNPHCLPLSRSSELLRKILTEELWVTLRWTSIPSRARGNDNVPSYFMLGILWWTSIPSRGSSIVPSHLMLGLASHPGGLVMFLVTLWWVSCDGLASHPGGGGRGGNASRRFMLQKPPRRVRRRPLMSLMARSIQWIKHKTLPLIQRF